MIPIELYAHEVERRPLRLADLASTVPMMAEIAAEEHRIGYQQFGLSFHHSLSIASHLHRHGLQLAASAFALARPMIETLQRGWWFFLCGSHKDAQDFLLHDRLPISSLRDVLGAVENHPFFKGTNLFSELGRDELNAYHSFTHGGLQAMSAYSNRPQFDPLFDAVQIFTLLDNAERVSSLAALGACSVSATYNNEAAAARGAVMSQIMRNVRDRNRTTEYVRPL